MEILLFLFAKVRRNNVLSYQIIGYWLIIEYMLCNGGLAKQEALRFLPIFVIFPSLVIFLNFNISNR